MQDITAGWAIHLQNCPKWLMMVKVHTIWTQTTRTTMSDTEHATFGKSKQWSCLVIENYAKTIKTALWSGKSLAHHRPPHLTAVYLGSPLKSWLVPIYMVVVTGGGGGQNPQYLVLP